MKHIASLFTYPWDLHDEGIDRALDVMTGTAGMTSICLAVSYHISTYFLPHNPRRKIYYGEHGALYFQPDATKYRKTTIRPHVSEVVDGPHYLPALIERTRAKGIEFAVWVVYCFNHYLARAFPSCAKVDPFGSPYHAQLCPANPDVRAYFLAMTDDIVANYHPDAFHIESLSYLPFRYGFLNPKVLSDITPLCEFLMGLCYCPHCLAAADRAGLDGERFRAGVAGFLEKELARLPGKDEMTPPTDEHVNTLFDGRLSQFLQTRADVATSLFEEVVATVRSYGTTAIQTVVPTQEDLLSSGLSWIGRWVGFHRSVWRPPSRPSAGCSQRVPRSWSTFIRQRCETRMNSCHALDNTVTEAWMDIPRTTTDCSGWNTSGGSVR